MIGIAIAGWLLCGAFTYAGLFAYSQREWPTLAAGDYRGDLAFSVLISLSGPIGLFVTAFMTEFFQHGLKWK